MRAHRCLGGVGVTAQDGVRDEAMILHGAPGLLDGQPPQASRAREQLAILAHQPLQSLGMARRRDGQVKLFVQSRTRLDVLRISLGARPCQRDDARDFLVAAAFRGEARGAAFERLPNVVNVPGSNSPSMIA